MRLLPANVIHQFTVLNQKGIDVRDKTTHLKWLRLYLGFRHRYHYDAYHIENLPPFLDKLQEKGQSDPQRNQARQTIAWFYRLQLISNTTSSVLASTENLAGVNHNPVAALKSVVFLSKAITENATASTARSLILAQLGTKRPSQPDSYNQ